MVTLPEFLRRNRRQLGQSINGYPKPKVWVREGRTFVRSLIAEYREEALDLGPARTTVATILTGSKNVLNTTICCHVLYLCGYEHSCEPKVLGSRIRVTQRVDDITGRRFIEMLAEVDS
jgi:hypothetical protein